MKRTNIYLSEPAMAVLKLLAEKRDVSVAELVRQAIEQFLRKNK